MKLENRVSIASSEIASKIYGNNPIAKLISREVSDIVGIRMKELRSVLRTRLNAVEWVFLHTVLMPKWDKRLFLSSLEFEDDIQKYVDEKLPEIKERLNILQRREELL